MLRHYRRGIVVQFVAALFRGRAVSIRRLDSIRIQTPRSEDRGFSFLAALRTHVSVIAERNFDRFEHGFVMETEALAVGDVTHVSTELAVGPQKIADRREQLLDMIVLLDQLRDIAGGARRGDVVERLRRLRIEPHAGNVLREHRDERQPKSLIEIRDELVARHVFQLAIILGTRLERHMPVHVIRIPPGVLQTLPEKPRLANSTNLVPPREHAFFAILPHQFTQRVHQLRLQILEPLIVWSKVDRGGRARRSAVVAALFRRRVASIRRLGFMCVQTQRSEGRGYSSASVAVCRCNRTRSTAPSFSCGVQVHSSSQCHCLHNLEPPRRGRLRFRAMLAVDARSGGASAELAAAWAAPEIPPAEIPPCPAANWSARDFPPAAGTLHLPASRRTSSSRSVAANSALDT